MSSSRSPQPHGGPGLTDFRLLYRKLERALSKIEQIENNTEMLETILNLLFGEFRDELGFEMGRLYERVGEDYVLCCTTRGNCSAPIGYRVPRDYLPHVRTLREGIVIMRKGEPGFDEEIEKAIGVTSTFAAIAVGRGNSHVFAFSVDEGFQEEKILYSLSAVRHVINLKLEQRKLSGILEEARRIQESLLPPSSPAFEGYDIHGISRPAEVVGGDLFDFLSVSPVALGIAIADATGHGLPAALVARDVITGLRVIMNENLKVVRVVERLNRVIHAAAPTSMFISLFYGELETNGTLVYCNAGHNPPLIVRPRSFEELTAGGLILGPNPAAQYTRGYVHLTPGDALILYTDGLVDRENRAGQPFGTTRLRKLARKLAGADARRTAEALLAAADAHGRETPQQDDITIVVARRNGSGSSPKGDEPA